MTQHVILYLCRAQFAGSSAIPYATPPEVGSSHDCILFVSQDSPDHDFAAAHALLAKHGWTDSEMRRAGTFQSESINPQQMRVFQHHYEECLEHGDSLAWYA
ncbi:hypothetical protein XA1311A_24050 [Xanthomonas arboricola]|nr:hypothetical protein XarbCFBP8147_02955 [Xanthomonas arboricola]CAE6781149.1 hypothetical protein XA1311A_24050 [Xanthomonas arboricola]CAE6781175.1 hypothetical protein XA1311A_24050 [Xanthomonas arboricola]